jgi:class 3 adenylate cyclase
VIGENPFYHRGPIKETRFFYDRNRETALSLQMVKRGQSISVIGPRRIGKTSLLIHLSDSRVRGEHGFRPEQSLFVYIDGEMLGGLIRADILGVMLQEAAYQSNKEKIDIPQLVDHHSFERTIRALLKPDQQLVYLIDEFECLAKNRNLDANFFSFLRSLTVRYNVAYVTASQIPLLALIEEEGQLSSPFFNIFMPIQLCLFGENDARQMIRQPSRSAGIEFDGNTEDFILDLAGPHPFFLQIACFHAFELMSEYPAFNQWELRELEENVQADLRPHFEYFTSRLSEEELRALACLLDSEQSGTPTEILEDLERKCLVRQSNGQYVLLSQAFAHFARQKIGTWDATIAEGERRMATVLFADVVGFTPMIEQHIPEEILSIIKPALRMFVDVVDSHKGKVVNFGGDSIMAVFGVPTEQPDDAIRAVRAALEIQTKVALYAQELKQSRQIDFAARVGLDTGLVVLGEIGGEQRSEYTALGDAVNLAQRLEALAQPGTIVISDHTYQQIRGQFKTKSLGLKQVKGKSRPVKTYQVLGEKAHGR